MSNEDLSDTIEVVRKMNSKQLSAIITLIIAVVAAAFWVENRYVHMEYLNKSMQETAEKIEKTENRINFQASRIDSVMIVTSTIISSALTKEQQLVYDSALKRSKESFDTAPNR